ncbi:MAG TPA: AAA family ATPase [Alphaproteobacteria bacterium]|nr:AAA family ATPase [Alphaproteobacteria bacterium]
MAVDTISVGLDIKNEWLRGDFAETIAAQHEFYLTQPDQHRTADLLILELDEDRGKTFSRIQAILAASPTTEIFLTSPHTDPAVLLEALRAGVKEFIPQPLKRDELEEAFARFKERHKERYPATAKRGKLITIIGSKGGVGTTTIAVNLAVSLRHMDPDRSAVLVDLNPQFGDAGLFLDIESSHTMGDIAKNVARLDETLLMSILSRHASGLFLLPAVEAINEIGLLTPDVVEKTLNLLQVMFDYVIIDSGNSLADTTLATLNISPTTFLVCTLTLPVLRNAKRLLNILDRLHYPIDRIRVIVNRYEKGTEVSLEDMEEVLGRKASWMIPNDYFVTMNAINKGQPLASIARRADVTKSFTKLAQTVIIGEQQMYKPSLLSRLFKSN